MHDMSFVAMDQRLLPMPMPLTTSNEWYRNMIPRSVFGLQWMMAPHAKIKQNSEIKPWSNNDNNRRGCCSKKHDIGDQTMAKQAAAAAPMHNQVVAPRNFLRVLPAEYM